MSVDNIDLRLIRCLQDNPRASYSKISRITGVSETTVKRRVDALIESRVVTTAVFPNPWRLGYRIQAMIGLTIEPEETTNAGLALREFPEVAFVSQTFGRFDVMIYVVVPEMNDLIRFVTEEISAIPGIKSTETIMSARVFKAFANWRVPLEELAEGHDGREYDLDPEEYIAF